MRLPPRSQKEPIIDRPLIFRVLLSAGCVVAGTIFVYMVRATARCNLDVPRIRSWGSPAVPPVLSFGRPPPQFTMVDGHVNGRDRTMTFTTFVFFDMFNALACRSDRKSVFQLGLFSNRMFVYAVGNVLFGSLAGRGVGCGVWGGVWGVWGGGPDPEACPFPTALTPVPLSLPPPCAHPALSLPSSLSSRPVLVPCSSLAPGGCFLVQLAVIYVPWLQSILQTEALALSDLLSILVLSSLVLWVDELRKWLTRRTVTRTHGKSAYRLV